MCEKSGLYASNYRRLTDLKLKVFTHLQSALRDIKIEDIKNVIMTVNLSALYLLFDLSLKSEDYHICHAIKQVIAERPLPTEKQEAEV